MQWHVAGEAAAVPPVHSASHLRVTRRQWSMCSFESRSERLHLKDFFFLGLHSIFSVPINLPMPSTTPAPPTASALATATSAAPATASAGSTHQKKRRDKYIKTIASILNPTDKHWHSTPSNLLCILNGGSTGVNGTSFDDITSAFNTALPNLSLGIDAQLIMAKGRGFSFLCFQDSATAALAHNTLDFYHISTTSSVKPSSSTDFKCLFVAYFPENSVPPDFWSNQVLVDPTLIAQTLPGLLLVNDFISVADQDFILLHLGHCPKNTIQSTPETDVSSSDNDWIQLRDRSVMHSGFQVNYSETITPDSIVPAPMLLPHYVLHLLPRLAPYSASSTPPNQLTVNKYHPGRSIVPHMDHPIKFGPTIYIISLLSPIVLEFISEDSQQSIQVDLKSRSLLVMKVHLTLFLK